MDQDVRGVGDEFCRGKRVGSDFDFGWRRHGEIRYGVCRYYMLICGAREKRSHVEVNNT